MTTSVQNEITQVEIREIHFDEEILFVDLSDGRQIGLPFKKIRWLDWLAKATPKQRAKWSIEPYGYAVWWAELDDGFEIEHILSLYPLPHKQEIEKPEPIPANA